MKVALVADSAWLDEELPMFRQLVVGLLADSVGVVQVVPQKMPPEEFNGFGTVIPWNDSGWWVLRELRMANLVKELEVQGVNVIHALDSTLWRGASKIAQKAGLPLVVGANRAEAIDMIPDVRALAKNVRTGFIASTIPLYERLKSEFKEAGDLEHVAPGVQVRALPEAPEATPGSLTIAVCGSDKYDADCAAFFEAVGSIIREFPQTQFFYDAQGRDPHSIWRGARERGLLSNISMVPRRIGHHELLLKADVLVHPQPTGGSRGITLQAMSLGVPVLARKDPWSDLLVEPLARIIERTDAEAWHRALRGFVVEPMSARQLGQTGREWIRVHRPVSVMVGQYVAMYRNVVAEAIDFSGPAR